MQGVKNLGVVQPNEDAQEGLVQRRIQKTNLPLPYLFARASMLPIKAARFVGIDGRAKELVCETMLPRLAMIFRPRSLGGR